MYFMMQVVWWKFFMDYFFIVGMFVFEKDDYISVDYKILFSDVVEWNFVIK